jgi:hypothetical protein
LHVDLTLVDHRRDLLTEGIDVALRSGTLDTATFSAAIIERMRHA